MKPYCLPPKLNQPTRSPKEIEEARTLRLFDQLRLRTGQGVMALQLVLIASLWGRWRTMAITAGLLAVCMVINMVLIPALQRRGNAALVRNLGGAWTLVLLVAMGHLTSWSAPFWPFLLVRTLFYIGFDERPDQVRIVSAFLLLDAVSLWDGASWPAVAAFTILPMVAYVVSSGRTKLIGEMLVEAETRQRELELAHLSLQEVHERALAQAKLAGLGVLAAGMAHEINNPMSFVGSNVRSLQMELQQMGELPSALREYVDDVLPATLDGIRRVNAIVADLRRFARGDPDGISSYNLNDEVTTAVRMVSSRFREKCELIVNLGEVPPLLGRARQINQVIVNVLVNASQAIPSEGRVFLTTRTDGDDAVIEIRDTGTGMSPQTRERLFQPFFTTKSPGEGTGLGLAVVHGLVASHGGRIDVESEPGKGSCFTIYLPPVPPTPETVTELAHLAGPRIEFAQGLLFQN